LGDLPVGLFCRGPVARLRLRAGQSSWRFAISGLNELRNGMMAVHSKSVSSYLMIRGPPFGSFAVTSGRRFSDASQQGGKFVSGSAILFATGVEVRSSWSWIRRFCAHPWSQKSIALGPRLVNAVTLPSRKESFRRCTVTGRQETTVQKNKAVSASMSLVGTFETCRWTARMSVHRGRPEVSLARSERRD